jgi:hypothetical protein
VHQFQIQIRAITRYAAAAAILVSLAFLVNFISAASGTAGTEKSYSSLPETISQTPLVEKIVAHRDFFMRFNGYDGDENLLCDVEELGEGKIGLLLLEPSGFLKSLVFDRSTLGEIHKEASIPSKKVRADLARNAVLISDARLIARHIAGLRTENTEKSPRRKTTSHETPRREAMPQSLPDGFTPEPAGERKIADTGAGKILERLRRDVENNPDVATMTSDEILERFRSDVARRKEAKP